MKQNLDWDENTRVLKETSHDVFVVKFKKQVTFFSLKHQTLCT